MSAQIAGYILGGRICIPYAHAHADVRALLVSGPLSSFFFPKCWAGLQSPMPMPMPMSVRSELVAIPPCPLFYLLLEARGGCTIPYAHAHARELEVGSVIPPGFFF